MSKSVWQQIEQRMTASPVQVQIWELEKKITELKRINAGLRTANRQYRERVKELQS